MITLEEAKQLKYGDVLIDEYGKRWKVNGEVKLWKRDADRIRVPLKHGLYAYGALTEMNFGVREGAVVVCNYMTKEQR